MVRTPGLESQGCEGYDYTNQLSVQRGIFLPIEILEQEIDFLLDTGADITLISIGTWNNIPEDLKPTLQNSEGQVHNVEGKPLSLLGTCQKNSPLHQLNF